MFHEGVDLECTQSCHHLLTPVIPYLSSLTIGKDIQKTKEEIETLQRQRAQEQVKREKEAAKAEKERILRVSH